MRFRIEEKEVVLKNGEKAVRLNVMLGGILLPNIFSYSGKTLKEIGVEGVNEEYNYYLRGSVYEIEGKKRYSLWANPIGGSKGVRIDIYKDYEIEKLMPILKRAEEFWKGINAIKSKEYASGN
jgi:hypothetical protein